MRKEWNKNTKKDTHQNGFVEQIIVTPIFFCRFVWSFGCVLCYRNESMVGRKSRKRARERKRKRVVVKCVTVMFVHNDAFNIYPSIYNKLTKETDACRAVRTPRTMNLPIQYYVRHIYQVKRKIDFFFSLSSIFVCVLAALYYPLQATFNSSNAINTNPNWKQKLCASLIEAAHTHTCTRFHKL